jgi:hypothetical protein
VCINNYLDVCRVRLPVLTVPCGHSDSCKGLIFLSRRGRVGLDGTNVRPGPLLECYDDRSPAFFRSNRHGLGALRAQPEVFIAGSRVAELHFCGGRTRPGHGRWPFQKKELPTSKVTKERTAGRICTLSNHQFPKLIYILPAESRAGNGQNYQFSANTLSRWDELRLRITLVAVVTSPFQRWPPIGVFGAA